MADSEPRDRPSDPAPRRRPLSLREMLVVTTLAAVALALVLHPALERDERWLLGLSTGSALLGLTISRALGRSAWLGGLLVGAIGGAVVVGILGSEWLKVLDELAFNGAPSAESLDIYRSRYQAAALGTLMLGGVLSMLAITAFQLAAWAITTGERGLVSTIRRHPYWTASAVLVLGFTVGLLLHADYIVRPGAWTPRYALAIPQHEGPHKASAMPTHRVALSQSGEWLALYVVGGRVLDGIPKFQLYRLQETAQRWEPDFTSEVFAFSATHPHRFVYATRTNENRRQLHKRDLATGKDVLLVDLGDDDFLFNIHWLPSGSIALDDALDSFMLQPEDNRWRRAPLDSSAFNVRLNYEIRYRDDGASVVRLDTEREIVQLTPGQLDLIRTIRGWLSSVLTLEISIDGRFVVVPGGDAIFDLRTGALREYDERETGVQFFETITKSGYAVASSVSRWDSYWLTDVPFGPRLRNWLLRAPVVFIDPATGREVARTQPLWSPPDAIGFSHDGSRMAVLNREGVYVYDVPEEFR